MLASSFPSITSAIDRRLSNDKNSISLDVLGRNFLNVALIGPSALFGEVLVTALSAAEPAAQFALYPSLDEWFDNPARVHDRVLLLFFSDEEFNAPEKSKRMDLERLKSLESAPRFIICANHEHHSQVLKALEVGAEGYIVPSMSLKVLIQVIHLVDAGGVFVPASSLKHLSAAEQPAVETTSPSISGLSPRQILVAKALRKGTPNKVIAYELNMCESTVKVHVRHIMKKLQAKNRTQIAFLTNALFSESDKN